MRLSTLIILLLHLSLNSQSVLTKALLDETPIDDNLRALCDQIGGRVTGSEANNKSVDWAYKTFKEAGVKVETQDFEMPALWLPGGTTLTIEGETDYQAQAVAKYMSPSGTYESELVYVGFGRKMDYDSLQISSVEDKIILVESDLCLDIDGLFEEYAHASEVETEAARRNVKAIVFMASRPTKLLYRFITSKGIDNSLPQIVMSREDAKRAMRRIIDGESLNVKLNIKSQTSGSFTSSNVIAEIPGVKYPDEIILLGAHIDSWALGTGANDNGCNVSMLIDIARQMKALDIKPDRTIRFALWNGEEQGYFGSWAYTKKYEKEMDKHRLAISIDIGSGAITGFFTNGDEDLIPVLDNCFSDMKMESPLTHLNIPIVGTDNFDFMLQGVPNLVAIHKPATYGINYHASSDTYDKVDIASLKTNATIVAELILDYANMDSKFLPQRNSRTEIEAIFEENNLEFTMRMFNVWEPWANKVRGRVE